MEPKKNPKYDVHKKSKMTFFFSLCMSILLVLTAFQWKHPVTEKTIQCERDGAIYDPLYSIPVTEIINTPKEPDPLKEKPMLINPVETKEEPVLIQPTIDPPAEMPVEPVHIPGDLIEPEVLPTEFLVVEKMPMPKGGYESFYKFLSKELKFPKAAIRNQASGKVYIEFVVNKDGEITKLRIMKGIGYGCDEEALRVLALTKWEAGKQRGIPVHVKLTMPINFEIR